VGLEPVTAIAQAIAAASKTLGEWLASSDRRKLKRAIEYAEQYIFTNEKEELSQDAKAKLLKKYRKLFFKFN
jgi:hypothetical protein